VFTITEIYNNIVYNPALKREWGFSCYIKESDLLFDTGGDSTILRFNMNQLGINIQQIKHLVISHDHWDHNGGIAAVLEENSSIEVYVLEGFSHETLNLIKEYSSPVFVKGWTQITDNIYSTGPLGNAIIEQSLVVKTKRGLVVITGCAHPHISTILDFAGMHGDVIGALGGFHSITEEDISALGNLQYLSASHCTEKLEDIMIRYPERFEKGGVGKVHSF
jgi:7,8-dihydropterin-6-yl-methyl-4-(beta-D-ribofuranosyl)aminobenzene 5'-phosphate synthase